MSSPFQGRGVIFYGAGRSGWSESYYLSGADYTTCVGQLYNIGLKRLAILQMDVSIVAAYVSNIYVRGDATPVTGLAGFGTWPTSAQFMPVDYAIQLTWIVGVYSRNKTFIRGFPLEMQTDGAYIPTSGFITAMASFAAEVESSCVFRQYVPNPTPPPAMIYQFNGSSGVTYKFYLTRRKTGRPFGLPRGRLVAP